MTAKNTSAPDSTGIKWPWWHLIEPGSLEHLVGKTIKLVDVDGDPDWIDGFTLIFSDGSKCHIWVAESTISISEIIEANSP